MYAYAQYSISGIDETLYFIYYLLYDRFNPLWDRECALTLKQARIGAAVPSIAEDRPPMTWEDLIGLGDELIQFAADTGRTIDAERLHEALQDAGSDILSSNVLSVINGCISAKSLTNTPSRFLDKKQEESPEDRQWRSLCHQLYRETSHALASARNSLPITPLPLEDLVALNARCLAPVPTLALESPH